MNFEVIVWCLCAILFANLYASVVSTRNIGFDFAVFVIVIGILRIVFEVVKEITK